MTTAIEAVTVRYFAAARAAAGSDSETVDATTLAELVFAVGDRHGTQMAKVLGVCSFLVDGTRRTDHDAPIAVGSTVDVLPPFAGG